MIAIKVLKIFGGIILMICAVLLFYYFHNYYEKHQDEPLTIFWTTREYIFCFLLFFWGFYLLASAINWL